MGIHVQLSADPNQIHPDAWRDVYRESWRVLKAYPNEALNAVWREIKGEKVPVYARDLDDVSSLGPGWRVCGDALSKLTAESFAFPENFGRAQPGAPVGTDLLVRAAREGYFTGAGLFSEKTQGQPYHLLVLAVATLVENRFPGAALAHGEISVREGEEACDLLERALGERMLPPIVLDPARMRERLLPSLGAEASELAAQRLHPTQDNPVTSAVLAILSADPKSILLDELETAVTCSDVQKLSPITRKRVAEAARSLADIARQLGMNDPDPTRPEFTNRDALLRRIAIGTRANNLKLTEDAWSVIQAESIDSLRFLCAVASAKADGLHLHLLSRAWCESEELRRFGLAQWGVKSVGGS